MIIEMQEKNEEILWQSKVSFKSEMIMFLISIVSFIIGIIISNIVVKFLDSPHAPLSDFLLTVLALSVGLTLGLPLIGIVYTILIFLSVKIAPSSYFATNKKIVEKWEKKEYDIYFTFEYPKINKIELHSGFFFKNKVVTLRLFPKFNLARPFEWKFQYFKDQNVKLPRRLNERYHSLDHISNYDDLLEVLKKYRVNIIYK